MYYKVGDAKKTLPKRLEAILQKYVAYFNLVTGVRLTEYDYSDYFHGLSDAGVKGAPEMLADIKKHGEVCLCEPKQDKNIPTGMAVLAIGSIIGRGDVLVYGYRHIAKGGNLETAYTAIIRCLCNCKEQFETSL